MNIAFDASAILGRSGIERYSRELIKGLARSGLVDRLTLLVDVHDDCRTANYFKDYPDVDVRECLPSERRFGAPLRPLMRPVRRRAMSRAALGADVVHLLAPGKIVPDKRPIVTTIHDLFPMYPDMGLDKTLMRRFPGRVRRHLEASSAIMCPSSYVAETVRERFPWFRGAIHVTPLAASDSFSPRPVTPETAARFELHKPYVLYIGRIDPRKNLQRMLSAWRSLPQDIRRSSEFLLVMAGGSSFVSRFRDEHREILADSSVRIITDVGTEQMIQLLSSARALAFATLGEGFGLPVIEAMRCGCPVITSRNTSLPEVGGEAALYVDPLRVEDIADAMTQCLMDDALVSRMRAQGIEHSARFTWDATARATAAVYRSVMG